MEGHNKEKLTPCSTRVSVENSGNDRRRSARVERQKRNPPGGQAGGRGTATLPPVARVWREFTGAARCQAMSPAGRGGGGYMIKDRRQSETERMRGEGN